MDELSADGAMAKCLGKGGGGVVARDHDGRFLAGASHCFPSLSDPEHAELHVCRRAMTLSKELRMDHVVQETDSLGVVSKLTNIQTDRSIHVPLVEEIKSMLRLMDDHSVKWARRSANGAAHILDC